MDLPIYIHLVSEKRRKITNLLYVIEERDGAGEASAAGEGLGKGFLTTEKERVRVLHLPNLSHRIMHMCSAVANSRLFLVGGSSSTERGAEINQILYVDMQQKQLFWDTIEITDCPKHFSYMRGIAVSNDSDWIYGLGGSLDIMFRLHPHGSQTETVPFHPRTSARALRFSVLLALTDTKMFLFCASCPSGTSGELGYYDLKSLSWHTIDSDAKWCLYCTTAVVVRDKYLIAFSAWHPITEDYVPALYVYDITLCKWLSEPVQGLPNDGIVLPPLFGEITPAQLSGEASADRSIVEPYLMQVRRDELKFAFVWFLQVGTYKTQVHWSKFILRIQPSPPTFRAEHVSSQSFFFDGIQPDVSVAATPAP